MTARPSSSGRVPRPDLDDAPAAVVPIDADPDAATPTVAGESPRVGRRLRAEPDTATADPIASRPVRRAKAESPPDADLVEPVQSRPARRTRPEPGETPIEGTPLPPPSHPPRETSVSGRARRAKADGAPDEDEAEREAASSGRLRRQKADDEPARTEGEALVSPPRPRRAKADVTDEPASDESVSGRVRQAKADSSEEAPAIEPDAVRAPRAKKDKADATATPPGGTRAVVAAPAASTPEPEPVYGRPVRRAARSEPRADASEERDPLVAGRSGRKAKVEGDPPAEPVGHAHGHSHGHAHPAVPPSPTPASAQATPGAPVPAPQPASSEPGPRFEEARPTRTPMPVEPSGEPEDQPISAELLQKRICDLGLQIEGRLLGRVVERFKQELREVGITRVVPGFYLSTEWGVAEETIAIAIPFYLADEELTKVQAAKGGIVEGTSEEDILRYLRHEMGHVINYAYKLYQSEEWSLLFGPMARPYAEDYRAVPFSPEFVRHLPGNYAQKHPDEDWSETFAVWMDRSIEWRALYSDAPGAIKKLEYRERTLRHLVEKDPLVTDLTPDEDVSEIRLTIGEFYEGQGVVELRVPRSLDGDLRAIFGPLAPAKPAAEGGPRLGSGSLLLRRQKDVIANAVFRWTSVDPAYVRPILEHLIRRAKELDLTYPLAERDTVLIQITGFLTTLAMNYVYKGRFIAS